MRLFLPMVLSIGFVSCQGAPAIRKLTGSRAAPNDVPTTDSEANPKPTKPPKVPVDPPINGGKDEGTKPDNGNGGDKPSGNKPSGGNTGGGKGEKKPPNGGEPSNPDGNDGKPPEPENDPEDDHWDDGSDPFPSDGNQPNDDHWQDGGHGEEPNGGECPPLPPWIIIISAG